MRLRTLSRPLLVLAAVAAVLIGGATPADAAVALTPNAPVLATTANSYTFTTTLPYWSVIALRPASTVDFDLRLVDPGTGALLAGSYYGTGATDLVAINSNAGYRQLGSYRADTTLYSGSGTYSVMFWEKRQVMPVPTDPIGNTSTALALKFVWPVSATQIYLQQNQGFRVNHGSDTKVFLAGSTPGVPSTALRSRSTLENLYVVADNVPSPNGNMCRVFVAPAAGWYSVVTIWNTPWTPPPYDGGAAVFPQRYNPALGDTLTQCPDPVIP